MNRYPSVWRNAKPLVLASKSRARQMLLEQAGLSPLCHAVAFDERAFEANHLHENMKPAEIALALSVEKARLAADDFPDHYVVGADQILTSEDRVLHKAANRVQAVEQLASLAGKTHRLVSACAVLHNGKPVFEAYEEAYLTMRHLTQTEITRYLDLAGETVLANVGCYALEGLGVHLFDKIEGEFFTILGLPLQKLLAFFRQERCLSI